MDSEDGFILLAVLFLLVLVLIGLAVAAPQIARSIQRDKELELVHRGEQYKRAIKLYYKKYGAYPTSIDQLVETNNVRFLRKRYKDPITGKDDWRLIYYGQAKVPPMGLFGQPLTGLGQPGAVVPGATTPGTSSTSGSSSPSTFGTSPSSPGGYVVSPPSNPFGSSDSDSANADSGSSDAGTAATNDQSAAPAASGSTTAAQPFGTSAAGTSNTPAGSASSAFGSTLSGGPIVGVGIPSTKASLIEYKKQQHYNKWEFVYNPIEDQLFSGGVGGATSTNPAGTGTTGSSTGIGSGSTIGPGGNNGGTTTTPVGGDLGPGGATTSPPQQQQ
jgi:type II secretory pathway pseudopilin PulG